MVACLGGSVCPYHVSHTCVHICAYNNGLNIIFKEINKPIIALLYFYILSCGTIFVSLSTQVMWHDVGQSIFTFNASS